MKQIPQDKGAERAILGAILHDPEQIYLVADKLTPEDFYTLQHKIVYETILSLNAKEEIIDIVTVGERLEQHKNEFQGTPNTFLALLTDEVYSSAGIESYIAIIRRLALQRNLLSTCQHIVQECYKNHQDDLLSFLGEAEESIFKVSQANIHNNYHDPRVLLEDVAMQIESVYASARELGPVAVTGRASGFTQLDSKTKGFQDGDLVILAARPSQGKSSAMMTLARHIVEEDNVAVGVFSMEMSATQLLWRLISQLSGVPYSRLRVGAYSSTESLGVQSAIDMCGQFPLYIDDTPGLSISDMRSRARRMQREKNIRFICVDYLQLMEGNKRVRDGRVQEVGEISAGLKAMARELDIPVLCLSQLNRGVEYRSDKRPMMQDLRESGCVTGDTQVWLPAKGQYAPIRELVNQSFPVLSLDTSSKKQVFSQVSRVFSTGVKEVYKLTTQLGRSVRVTANHKFLTINGWERLDQLKIGKHIALPRQIPSITKSSMSYDELALLAHLIGDGCTLPNHGITYTTGQETLAQLVVDLAKKVFKDEVRPYYKKNNRGYFDTYIASTRQHTHRVFSALREWLESLYAFGLRSYEKKVPAKVFQQPPHAISHFLRHLWATDGCISISRAAPRVFYATSSHQLAHGVQSLLLRIGINARIHRQPQGEKGLDQFWVVISGKSDMVNFINTVGSVGDYKKNEISGIISYFKTSLKANTNRDIIPHDIWRLYAIPSMKKNEITTRQMFRGLGTRYSGTSIYKQNVSRDRAMRLAQAVNSDEIKLLAESDIYWDKISNIEPQGQEEVYDLTVPDYHNFVANDFFLHNSIEQDADLILFLYRDEVYNDDSPAKGLCEVIIGKHRNGPLGTVNLKFLGETMQFVNHEGEPPAPGDDIGYGDGYTA
jgi:replicative DNA helicase